MAEARRKSCRLPTRLREATRLFRHDPGRDGVLIVRNLPVDEAELPLTPTVPESVERTATVPAAVAVMVTLQIGEIAAYRDEKSGALVQNVVPVPGREESQSNAGSTPLELHVENAFHPHCPDYVGLLCLRNDQPLNAGTMVSSIRTALGLLSPGTLRVLREERFTTTPPARGHRGGPPTPPPRAPGGPPDPPVYGVLQ
ncbi:clavaminate synthase, partial [Streptomyces sp. NPDC127074]